MHRITSREKVFCAVGGLTNRSPIKFRVAFTLQGVKLRYENPLKAVSPTGFPGVKYTGTIM